MTHPPNTNLKVSVESLWLAADLISLIVSLKDGVPNKPRIFLAEHGKWKQ
jgi:hypothetical protein